MPSKLKSALAIAGLTTTLAACATSGNKITLPPLPAHVVACLESELPAPANPPRSRKEVFALIRELKAAGDAKTECGKQLVAWYEAQRKAYAE